MSQIDICEDILAQENARGRVVTVRVNGTTFYKPMNAGYVVYCYGKCTRIENSSIPLKLEVWGKPVFEELENERYCVIEAVFTYASINQEGKSRKIER